MGGGVGDAYHDDGDLGPGPVGSGTNKHCACVRPNSRHCEAD